VGWLVTAAAVFTVYFGFIQFRAFGHAIALVMGRYSDPRHLGEVSHFQALTAALSGTVGLGNIAGVAVAVSIGGAGATFWMIVAGLLGIASKFTECTLGVKYHNEYPDGTVSGGPMYYIRKGFAERGLPFGRPLAALFAAFCVLGALGGGNMFQANQAPSQINAVFGVPTWVTGLVLAVVVFAVIVGGIRSIARVTEKVVPFMGLGYVVVSLLILLAHAYMILWAFGEILRGAFTDTGIVGGVVGAIIQGFRRAAFSNEAGVGSAAIAHSAVRTREPITEGFVSLLEPFIDTVVICTMTAGHHHHAATADRSGNRALRADRGRADRHRIGRDGRRSDHLGRLRIRLCMGAFRAVGRRDPVCLLDDHHLGLSRGQSLDLSHGRRRRKGTGVQDPLLRLCLHRRGLWPGGGDRLFRCGDLCHGPCQCRRALPADAGRQARVAKLSRAAGIGPDQACKITPDLAIPASFTCPAVQPADIQCMAQYQKRNAKFVRLGGCQTDVMVNRRMTAQGRPAHGVPVGKFDQRSIPSDRDNASSMSTPR
jgi:amino acid carrier protein